MIGILALVAGFALQEEDPVLAREKRIKEAVEKIVKKIDELIPKLQEKHPAYADKLRQAKARMAQDPNLWADKFVEIERKIEENQIAQAIRTAKEQEESLTALLALLEDRAAPDEMERQKKALEEAIRELKERIKDQEEIQKETRELKKDVERETGEKIQELERMMHDQQNLRNRTESGPNPELLERLEGLSKELDSLIEEERRNIQHTEEAKGRELKSVGELARRLSDLIDRQEDLKRDVEEAGKTESGIAQALERVDKLIQEQKKLADVVRRAKEDPAKADVTVLRKQQDDLQERAWQLGNDVYHLEGLGPEREPLMRDFERQAYEPMQGALRDLDEKDPDAALASQERAVIGMGRFRDELRRIQKEREENRTAEREKKEESQEHLKGETEALAGDMAQTAKTTEDPAANKALENAAGRTARAGQTQEAARGHLEQGSQDQAVKDQGKALDDLRAAEQELDKLQGALAQKKKNEFESSAEQEGKTADKGAELARRLHDLEIQKPFHHPDDGRLDESAAEQAEEQLAQAAGDAQSAAGGMGAAQADLKKPQPGTAQQSQRQALKNLQAARDKIDRLRDAIRKRQPPEPEKLSHDQKKLEEQLKNGVMRWLKQKGDKEPEYDEAAKAAQQALDQMQQARRSLDQSPPQTRQGGGQQGAARENLGKAKEALQKLARRPLNEEQKKKAEEAAKKQQHNKELTDELDKKMEGLQQEGARRSLGRASESMEGAQQKLQGGNPSDAEEDEEKALEDLKRAREEMEDTLEELRREAEQELLVALESELKKILETQEGINKTTRELDAIRRQKGALDRPDAIRSKRLGQTQTELSKALEQIRQKLEEENVEVYRFVVDSIIEDMNEVAANLTRVETGDWTQELEADIVRKIKDLLEAFAIKKKPSNRAGGGGGGGGGKPPLVPDLVQLNLIRKIQQDLLRRTLEFEKKYDKAAREDLHPTEKSILRRLSDEQDKLTEIMQRFIEKFEKAKEEQEP